MLYINYGNSKKRVYVNVKAIGQVLLGMALIAAYLYVSNQEYLIMLGK